MASAERAYRLNAHPDRAPEPSRRNPLRILRTGGRQEEQSSTSVAIAIAKMAAVIVVVVAALAFGRIALKSATVSTLIESHALSSQITEARSAGVGLEMEQSVLSSTYAIDAAAKRLGMVAPTEVGTIALDPDVVVTGANGALSLSGSVKALAENQG